MGARGGLLAAAVAASIFAVYFALPWGAEDPPGASSGTAMPWYESPGLYEDDMAAFAGMVPAYVPPGYPWRAIYTADEEVAERMRRLAIYEEFLAAFPSAGERLDAYTVVTDGSRGISMEVTAGDRRGNWTSLTIDHDAAGGFYAVSCNMGGGAVMRPHELAFGMLDECLARAGT